MAPASDKNVENVLGNVSQWVRNMKLNLNVMKFFCPNRLEVERDPSFYFADDLMAIFLVGHHSH